MARGRRANGEGSVYLRKDTGTYTAEITVGWDRFGSRISKRKGGFKTKREAREYIAKLKEQAEEEKTAGDKVKDLVTIGNMFHMAMERKDGNVSARTMQSYNAAYNTHLKQYSHFPFAMMRPKDWQAIIDKMEKNGVSHSYRNLTLSVIKIMIKEAILQDIITSDTSIAVRAGKTDRRLIHVALERWELKRVLEEARNGREISMVIAIMCFTGFRISEFLSLRIEDYKKAGYFVGGMKTEAGKNRVVPVSKIVQPFIDAIIGDRDSGLIISESTQSMRNKIKAECEAIGINPHTPHDFRRTMATMLKAVDAPNSDKTAIMGHANIGMTEYYQDHVASELKRAVDDMVEFLSETTA